MRHQFHAYSGILVHEGYDGWREFALGKARDDMQAQRSFWFRMQALRVIYRVFDRSESPHAAVVKIGARFGQRYTARGPIQERNRERFFELLDLLANGRWGNLQFSGRERETSERGNPNKGL